MKPHEETWTVAQEGPRFGPRIASGHTNVAYIALPYRVEGRWFTPDHERGASLARLIAAAPDMARALLASGAVESDPDMLAGTEAGWHTRLCATGRLEYGQQGCSTHCTQVREALQKAGVL